jgi:hypothetical protein
MAGLTNIIARIKALITADNKDFKKKMSDTERTAKKTGKSTQNSFKQMGNTIKTAMSAAIVLVGTKMVGALHKLTKEMGLMSFKATAVFGLYRKDVEAMAEDTAASMGLTKTEFVNAAAGIQDLLIPIGFARKEATGMTKDMIALSGALSTWTGGTQSAADVGNIFAKAMLGEREQLKTLGIAISEAEVKMRLAEKGQDKLTGSTLAQAKAQATLELITEKSTDAQAAFAEEQDNVVITSAQVGANLRSVAENISVILAPALEGGTKLLADMTSELKQMSDEAALISQSDLLTTWEKWQFRLAGLTGGASGMIKQMELLGIAASATEFDAIVDELLNMDGTLEQVEKSLAQFGDMAVQHGIDYFNEQKKLRERDEEETAAAEKQAQTERLQTTQQFYWALEGALMAHNDEMKGLWTEANNAQALALQQSSEALEEYHNNLGLILEQQPLMLPIIEATTTAQEAQREQMQMAVQDWNDLFNAIGMTGELMGAVSMSMVRASEKTGASFADVAKAGLNSARRLIKAYIAEGVAAAVKSALVNVPFPFNAIAAGLAGGGAAALFGRLVPSFAEGGMVTGPTLALVGDNPSGKEMIIPWEKLGELGGGAVEVTGVLKGTDMYLQNKRFSEKLARTGRA